MTQGTHWLQKLAKTRMSRGVPGLVSTQLRAEQLSAEQRSIVEKAGKDYGADHVFFRESGPLRQVTPEALVYVDDDLSNEEFAALHRRLWSWGAVPLVFRKRLGQVDLLRCAHGPDFFDRDGSLVYRPFETLKSLTDIDQAARRARWWQDSETIRTGALWDDPRVCATLLSSDEAAHQRLFIAIRDLHDDMRERKKLLPRALQHRLLVLVLLIAYLEDRGVLSPQFFAQHRPGASRFFEILPDAEALVATLASLERKFNGDVFALSNTERDKISSTKQLQAFSRFVEARTDAGNQIALWKLYSFRDLPIELISHIYQLFTDDEAGSVYTPPFLARLLASETLSWERLDSIREPGTILDPSCGSGVFLVEAYKRLVLHWRARNQWQTPSVDVLRSLLLVLRGVDLNEDAIELAAFSLCLAMCEALDADTIRKSRRLFPKLRGVSLHHACFFEHARSTNFIPPRAVLGNPPFKSALETDGEIDSAEAFGHSFGFDVPDKHVAYLFLSEMLERLAPGGVLCLLQQYSFLYNAKSAAFRSAIIERWSVREILDFTSVSGLFWPKNTKVVALVAEASAPQPDRHVLHAVFRRSGQTAARRGFELDYYDLHWVGLADAADPAYLWKCNLFGGGRVSELIMRLARMRNLGEYAQNRAWKKGEGFIAGDPEKSSGNDAHVRGRPFLPSSALTADGIDWGALDRAPDRPIERPRTPAQFTPPMLLVRENIELQAGYVGASELDYLTFSDQVYGFCAPPGDARLLRDMYRWLHDERDTLRAYIAVTSDKAFTKRETAISAADIKRLPYPGRPIATSANEKIIIADILDYFRDFIRKGEKSELLRRDANEAMAEFTCVYARQINAVYGDLRALPHVNWPGAICQPFVFGSDANIDWESVDELHDRITQLVTDSAHMTSLSLHRIARVYDGNFVFLLKPDRLRFWLRSIALRDADETLADLRNQGF